MQNALLVSQLVISFFVAFICMKALTWLVRELSQQQGDPYKASPTQVASTQQALTREGLTPADHVQFADRPEVGSAVRPHGSIDVFDSRRQSIWPRWAQRLAWPLLLILPVANQLSRDSAEVRRQLTLVGFHRRFDDREFSRLQIATSLLAALSTGALLGGLRFVTVISLPVIALWSGAAFVLIMVLGRIRLRDRYQLSKRRVSASLPNLLDVLALTLESGQNFQSAVNLAISRMPDSRQSEVLKVHLQELTRDLRSGESRANALQKFSDRLCMPEVTQFVASVMTAERQGASISNILRRQAEQLRTTRALAAERVAMKAPVKLLAPLAICIFPCTFAILMFPIAVRLSDSGLF